jgi:hypothetical protein
MNTPFLDYGKSLSQKRSCFIDIGQRNESFKKNEWIVWVGKKG